MASRTGGLGDERGSFLIETLVAAVLVAVIAVAMLNALDGANQASGRTKMRAISASLAQTDQERMRSLPVSLLNNMRQTTTKSVAGVNYTVASRADWLADDTSTTDCSSNGSAGDYMEITSTVTSTTQATLRPVVVRSIVTPAPGTLGSNQGSLALTVVDRNGVGVPGINVAIDGPNDATDFTDANGCVFFGYEPVGSYAVTATRSGWVDIMGRISASATLSIASQQVSTKQLQYDAAGAATIAFATTPTDYISAAQPAQPRNPATITGQASRIRLTHGSMETPGIRDGAAPLGTAPWGGSNASQIVASSLFPFTSPYGVYGGQCDQADPAAQTPTAQTVDTVQVTAGSSASATVALPALNIRAFPTIQRVRITPAAGCGNAMTFTRAADFTNNNLTFPGLPYGTYTVCGDTNAGGSTRRITVTPVQNNKRSGTSPVPLDPTASGNQSGSCP